MARQRFRGAICAIPLAAAAVAAPAVACERPQGWGRAQEIAGKTWKAWWRSEPAIVEIGRHFAIRFHLCGPPARTAKVRGWMPDHRHGMNYRAAVSLTGPKGAARGLLFHMPGRWQLILDIAGAAGREKLTAEMVLE